MKGYKIWPHVYMVANRLQMKLTSASFPGGLRSTRLTQEGYDCIYMTEDSLFVFSRLREGEGFIHCSSPEILPFLLVLVSGTSLVTRTCLSNQLSTGHSSHVITHKSSSEQYIQSR